VTIATMRTRLATAAGLALFSSTAYPAGGPLGIDHPWVRDETGPWRRSTVLGTQALAFAGTLGIAAWEGGETRLGLSAWKALDSAVAASAATMFVKRVFARSRPREGNDPDAWFQGAGNESFVSDEVARTAALVTPFILEYGAENPAVYTLAALPAYVGVSRMKAQAHWQTDVMAAATLGAAVGAYAHARHGAFFLDILPGGAMAGLKKRF
jgi:undecaprenyl-diphosphatase